jgi:hypothetical protein
LFAISLIRRVYSHFRRFPGAQRRKPDRPLSCTPAQANGGNNNRFNGRNGLYQTVSP